MLKISEATNAVMNSNPFLQFGISNGLLNLTQTAKFIHPLVESRVKKEVSLNALLMALSRIQTRLKKIVPSGKKFVIDRMTVNSDLCIMSYTKDDDVLKKISRIYNSIQKREGYITITEGVNEITFIFDQSYAGFIENNMGEKPISSERNIASIGIKFSEKYMHIPGLLYSVLQQISLQNINIIEIASTYTEFIVYIEKKDIKLAFDTLFQSFSSK